MEFRTTAIDGLIEIFPRVFKDDRGYFFESYHYEIFKQNGIDEVFVQDNQSFSTAGVLRGLHLQLDPYAQGKLVRVLSGKVLDIAVDVRPNSPTFGQYERFLLTAEQQNMAYIPPGFAHGFVALEASIFSYKCTNYYNKAAESGIIWNDSELNIDWGITQPLVSPKDEELPSFAKFKTLMMG